MATTFEDLDAFKYAVELVAAIYTATKSFPKREHYGLASQLRRAGVSVVSNIAEGEGRLTPGEWRQLLSHARGSLYEIEAQLVVAVRLGLLATEIAQALRLQTKMVGKPLAGLIRYVRGRESRHR